MELADRTFMQDLARRTYNDLRRVRWTADGLRRRYANRSGDQILSDKDIHWMGTCPELTLVAARMLEQVSEPYELVVAVFYPSDSFPLVRPHTVLELPRRHGHIDFTRLNQITIGDGAFAIDPEKGEFVRRVGSTQMRASEPLYRAFGFDRREAMNGLFPSLDIERLIEKMAADDTEANFARYRALVGNDVATFVEA
jgi:hypothetical protein